MQRARQRHGHGIRAAGALALLAGLAAIATAAAGAGPSPSVDEAARLDSVWEAQMLAGLDADALGDPAAAARHFRRAVARARAGLSHEEQGFALYRLGDVLRRRPDLARGESALALLEQARAQLARAYGPGHPVLLPVWARIATLHARAGRTAEADAARAAADAIAAHSFPARHFLRERFGAARAASVVQPLEVLHLLEGEAGATRATPPALLVRDP